MSTIFDVAESVLEVLRRDLHEWKESPDALAKVQCDATRREGDATREQSAFHPAPPFHFTPLTTAPTTQVLFTRESSSSRGTAAASSSPPRIASAELMLSARAPPPPSRGTHGQRQVPSCSSCLLPFSQERGEEVSNLGRETRKEKAPVVVSSGSISTHKFSAAAATSQQAEPSRWETRLQRLPSAAQALYADMVERGSSATLAVDSPPTTSQWRRRTSVPRDAELRRAVRDYLYRMRILSVLDTAAAAATTTSAEERGRGTEASSPCAVSSPAFADALMNGAALCQLVATLLSEGVPSASADAVPCRCPRTLNEVRVNYAAALSSLRTAPRSAREHMPAAAWSLVPEDVYLRGAPTALLELYVHLISTYLPSPEELPTWKPHLCWQPAADTSAYTPVHSTDDLVEAEAQGCAFLHRRQVLPDPDLYQLPGPECLIPPPTAAPFMSSWKDCVARGDAPTCLLVPAIWPFLCNGVLLVLLARRSGAEAAALARHADGVGTFFPNPRTVACCLANISCAFRSFQAVSTLTSSLPFFTAESAVAVLRGDRVHVVSLLLHLRAVLEGTGSAESALRRRLTPGVGTPTRSASAAVVRTPTRGAPIPSASSLQATPLPASNNAVGSTSSPPTAVKRRTPDTIAKGVEKRWSAAAAPQSRTATPPSAHLDPAIRTAANDQENMHPALAAPPMHQPPRPQSQQKEQGEQQSASPSRQRDSEVLRWLSRTLGDDFCYTAGDGSFTFDAARTASLTQPCWVFSDGVLLAHLIGLLECRRCDFLDCVQPAAKKAAKLFNVRRCLDFLRSSAGVTWEMPLLDEALVNGNAEGVRALLGALRSHYGAGRRNSVLEQGAPRP